MKAKVLDLNQLKEIVFNLKSQNKKIVFTNGCYDVLHPGHFQTLTQASTYGDILIIALNSDSSIKKFKSKDRPIFNEKARAEMIGNIKGVDYIIFFNEVTIHNLLEELKPDFLIKGGNPIPERVQKEKEIITEDNQ